MFIPSLRLVQPWCRSASTAIAMVAMSILFSSGCRAEPTAQSAGSPSAPTPVLAPGDFERFSDYTLEVGGKSIAGAEVYLSSKAGSVLVLASSFPTPVALNQRNGSVEKLNLMKVAKQADGTINLLPGSLLGNAGRFSLQGEDIVFSVDQISARLKPNPPLVGLHKRAELIDHSPEYIKTAAVYTPAAQTLESLKKVASPVRVRVFFGSWCHFCRQFLPRALKTEELLGAGSKVAFEYYGLPKPPAAWSEPETVKNGVKGVPTAIVYVNGKEAGRFTGQDWVNFDTILLGLINQPPAR